jgi:hypothetical protein
MTTTRSSVSIRRRITAATASMNLCPAAARRRCRGRRRARLELAQVAPDAHVDEAGSGHSAALIWRCPGLPPGSGSSSTSPISAISACAAGDERRASALEDAATGEVARDLVDRVTRAATRLLLLVRYRKALPGKAPFWWK